MGAWHLTTGPRGRRGHLSLGATLALVLCFASALVVLPQQAAQAALVRSFGSVFSAQVNGAISITGNTLERCVASAACTSTQNGTTSSGNNNFDMDLLDVDSDATTTSSSSATVSVPTGARVLYAGLFWGAATVAGSQGAAATGDKTKLRLQTPGAGAYQTVTASSTDNLTTNTAKDYSSFANITSIVQASGSGTYWGANISAATGIDRYAGWSIVVAYEDPTAPLRDLNIFSGYASVTNGETVQSTVSGFLAPPQGAVNAKFGTVAYEGDAHLSGDYFAVGNTRLADAESPSANYFQSRITAGGANLTNRSPAYVNNMGIDAKVIDAPGVVPNNATSATTTYSTSGDAYYPAALTTQIDLYAPTIRGTKAVRNLSGNDPAKVGDTLEYTMTYSNVGDDNATGSVVTDTLPPNTTYVPGSLKIGATAQTDATGDDPAEYTAASRTVRYRIGTGATGTAGGTLTTNATSTMVFRVTLDQASAGTTVNNAGRLDYTAATIAKPFTYNTAAVSTPVAESADVSITKTASPEPVVAGSPVTYTLTASNAGPSTATDVAVTDTLPDGVTVVSSTPTQGTCTPSGQTVDCALGSLASGATATITVVVNVPAGSSASSLVNVADIATSTSDPDPANNHASVASTVTRAADLGLTKTATPANPVPGTAVTWTLTATNDGPSTATNVILTDPVPSSFGSVTAVPSTGTCAVDSGAVSCTVPSLAPGASVTVTVKGTLDPAYAGGALTNRAEVQSNTQDPTPGNNIATSTVTPAAPAADLQVTKETLTTEVVAGRPISYRITVLNAGPSNAPAVSVTDTLPAGLTGATANPSTGTCSGTGTITCALGTLTAGSSSSVTVNATVAADVAGTLTNTASATSPADPGPNTATVTNPVVAQADLAITKPSTPSPVIDGQPVTYTLTVTNNGPSDARSVVVTDPVPAPLTYTSSSASQGTCSQAGGTVTCQLGTLAVGQTATVTVVAGTPPGGGANGVTNTASVRSTDPVTTDPTAANNTASNTLSAGAQANITMTKTVSPAAVVAGQTVTYTLTVRNAGPSDALGLNVTDTVPASVTSVAAVSAGAACSVAGNNVTCTQPLLLNGGSFTVTVTGTVRPSTRSGPLTNSATATAATPADPTQSDNTDSATDTVTNAADLAVTKTGPTTVVAGQDATWSIVVTNNGPSDVLDAQVRDALPPGVTFVSGSSPAGACGDSPGAAQPLVVCPIDALANGASQTITLTGHIDPDAVSGTVLTNTASGSSSTPDPNNANDNASSTSTVQTTADVSVVKTVDRTSLVAGADALYTLTVNNDGPSTARDASVVDTVPAGLTILSATAAGATCTVTGQQVTCTQASIPAGSSTVVRVAVRVGPGVTGSIVNSATVTSPTDTTPGNNTSSLTTPVTQSADLEVIKTADSNAVLAGTGVTYTITVVNHGPSDATGVVLFDRLPAGLTLVSTSGPPGVACVGTAPQIACDLGTVASGDAVALMVRASVSPDFTGSLTNSATARSLDPQGGPAVPDPDTSNNTGTSEIQVAASADVSVVKKVQPDIVVPGTEVDFSILVNNAGPSTATGVTVTDTVPAGLTILSATYGTTACAIAGQTITCPVGALVVGQVVIDVRTTLATGYSAAQVTNMASVATTSPDPDGADNASTTSAPVVRQADLQVVKTMSPANPVAGQRVTYTLTAKNLGPSDAVNPQFIDQLPAGLTNVSVVPPPGATGCDIVPPVNPGTADNPAAPTVTCSGPAFRAGFTVAGTITATVAPGFTGALVNTGRTSSDTIDPVATNNESTATGTVVQSADLAITKTMSPAAPVPGQDVTFTIRVTNAGPSTARDVTVTDPLDTVLTGATATTSAGTCAVDASNVVGCAVGAVAPGSAVTVTVTARLAADFTGTLTNAATVASSTTDPNPANNSASAAGLAEGNADVSIVKTGDRTSPVPGTAVTWTLTIANVGPSVAKNVVATDTVPGDFEGVTATSGQATCSVAVTTVSCTASTLAVGGTATVVVKGTLSTTYAGGPLTNTATVVSDTKDSNTTNNTSSVVTTPGASLADLQVTKTTLTSPVVAGQPIQYRIHVANAGPSDAAAVTVSDPIPAGLTDVTASPSLGTCSLGGGALACNLGTVPSGASIDVVVNAMVTPGTIGALTNTANVSSTTLDPLRDNNAGTTTDTVVGRADLDIRKDGAPRPVVNGQDVTYTLTVTNHGPSDARDVVISDPLPNPLTYVSSSPPPGVLCAEDGGSVTCDVGTIPLGGEVAVQVVAHVPSGGGADDLDNTATVTSSTPDPAPGNESATYRLLTADQANITLSKSVSPQPLVAGGPVTYTLTARNEGSSDASGIVITDDVPAAVTGVAATIPGGTCTVTGQAVSCATPRLNNATEVVATITGTVDPTAAAGQLSNTANVTSVTPADPTTSDNQATAATQVERSADLSVVKSGPQTAVAGTHVTYTVTITNAGPSSSEGVVLNDPLPAGLTFASGAGPGGACTIAGTLVTCSVGTIMPGTSATVTIEADVDSTTPPGPLTNAATASSVTPDPVSDNNTGATGTDVTTSADLAVTKTVEPTTLTAGGDALYRITVTNKGPSRSNAVVVDDALPKGLTGTGASAASGTCAITGSAVHCEVGDLEVGAATTVVVQTHVASDQTDAITNSARAASGCAPVAAAPGAPCTDDPDLSNNTGSVLAPVAQAADLELAKTASTSAAARGARVTYSLKVTNHGPSDTPSALVRDTLPAGLSLVSATTAGGACTAAGATVTCQLTAIPAGGSTVITVVATVGAQAVGAVTNSATVSSPLTDPTAENNTGAATLTVSAIPPTAPTPPPPPTPPAPSPPGDLPDTGTTVLWLGGLGLILLVSGAAAAWLSRRRRA